MSDVRKEAAGFVADYGYEPEEGDSSALKEVFRAANIMKRLLDDQFDLQNHVAYLESVVRAYAPSTPLLTAYILQWPRP